MFPFPRPSIESVSSATPTEVGAQCTSEIFHEAILASSSRVRDSLPEQHRAHFEALRQEIIDFAKAHDIPRESLAKPDALREAAKKLSIPDLTQLANLLERFEHLLVKKELLINKEALEYAEEFYHLEKQYTSQAELLREAGILKDEAILGIDGKKYPIPTLEQIAIRLFERREELKTKHDQGFTKLLLVPFGMSLDALCETFRQFLLTYKEDHKTFDLNTDDPLWTLENYQGADVGDCPNLVYYPMSFDKHDHQGKTKAQILEEQKNNQSPFPGWTIHLLQPSNLELQDTETPTGFAPIPLQGQGTSQGDITPRPPLETNKTPNEYLSLLQVSKDNEDSPYSLESGMTPEDWIIAFMTHLSETGKHLDDVRNPTETGSYCYLTGAFFPSSVNVPGSCWDRGFRQVRLGGRDSGARDGNIGARSSVMI